VSNAVPHTHPLRPWHDGAVAVAVAAQTFAIAHASPWLTPAWSAAASVALGLAALHPMRTRTVYGALAGRFGLTVAALALVGAALGPPAHYPHASPAANLAAAAFFAWAMHAPLTMSRWWVRAHPAQDGALEVVEPLGVSLVATVLALTVLNSAWAWSPAIGTAYSTGACVAIGLAAFVASWVMQLRRRAWMRRVLVGADPAWEVVDADGAVRALPWAHAAVNDAASQRLIARAHEAHYRDATVSVPIAGLGGRDQRAWWGRRGLTLLTLTWGVTLCSVGAEKLLHLSASLPPPRSGDPAGVVMRHILSLRVAPSPCAIRARNAGDVRHRVFEVRSGDAHDPTIERAEVWSTGRLVLTNDGSWSTGIATGTREHRHWMSVRCIAPSIAATWIDEPRPSAMMAPQAVWTLRAAPRQEIARDEQPLPRTPGGAWCTFGWRTAQESLSAGNPSYGVELDARGRFQCTNGSNVPTAVQVDARDATALLGAIRALAEVRGAARAHPTIDAFAATCGDGAHLPANFADAQPVWEALRRRLCVDGAR
jgi:hypothetical protein